MSRHFQTFTGILFSLFQQTLRCLRGSPASRWVRAVRPPCDSPSTCIAPSSLLITQARSLGVSPLTEQIQRPRTI